jgi:hypothetical protein
VAAVEDRTAVAVAEEEDNPSFTNLKFKLNNYPNEKNNIPTYYRTNCQRLPFSGRF